MSSHCPTDRIISSIEATEVSDVTVMEKISTAHRGTAPRTAHTVLQ